MSPKGSIEETGFGPNNKIQQTGRKTEHLRDFNAASREKIKHETKSDRVPGCILLSDSTSHNQ